MWHGHCTPENYSKTSLKFRLLEIKNYIFQSLNLVIQTAKCIPILVAISIIRVYNYTLFVNNLKGKLR